MAASKQAKPRRWASNAVLAVGEGQAEYIFMRHVKALYLPRACGTTATIKAATGKGAARVVAYTASISKLATHNRVIALLDTDTAWTAAVRAQAKAAGIIVIEATPCLEAVLLHISGNSGERTTAQHKGEFKKAFGMEAHDERMLRDVYPKGFDKAALEAAKSKVPALLALLAALTGA